MWVLPHCSVRVSSPTRCYVQHWNSVSHPPAQFTTWRVIVAGLLPIAPLCTVFDSFAQFVMLGHALFVAIAQRQLYIPQLHQHSIPIVHLDHHVYYAHVYYACIVHSTGIRKLWGALLAPSLLIGWVRLEVRPRARCRLNWTC